MKQLFSNNAISLLAESVDQTTTIIKVLSGHGNKFPNPNDLIGEYFIVTLEDQQAISNEIVKCVHRSGDILTVIRAQENTIAQNWDLHSIVDLRDTAETIKRLQPIINDQITINVGPDNFVRVVSSCPFEERTTQLWIGGARQAINIDYIEENSSTIKILWDLTVAGINEGQYVVLDYMRK